MYTFKAGDRVVNVRKQSSYFQISGTILNIGKLTVTDYAVVQFDNNEYKTPVNFNSLIPESVYNSKLYKTIK